MMKALEALRRSRLLQILAAVALFLSLFLVITSLRIVREAGKQELHPPDAIVVFGAAEYAGHPSPVLRARLDHAYDLFKSGLAPVVITTGGAAADPSFSEGGVGRDYLMHRGIPERNLIAETMGTDTA
ncbi:MAG: YdcF family protein, partial [Acidobacteria bacterium]